MSIITWLVDLFFHSDKVISSIVQTYGSYTYLFLFFFVFMETGFVLTPFFPGDSLIFISGVFASLGIFNIIFLFLLFCTAAIVGDSVNYAIGYYFGEKVFEKLVSKNNIEKTKDFFAHHGKRAIILARFAPIIRTFAPFVAGIGKMNYKDFFVYNVAGGITWVTIFLFSGYYFGALPFVKNNLSIIVILIVFASLIPIFLEYIKGRKNTEKKN